VTILPSGWVDLARQASFSDGDFLGYGALWWKDPRHPQWFYGAGNDGQRLLLVPEKDLVIVRMGRGGDLRSFRPVWDQQLVPLVELA